MALANIKAAPSKPIKHTAAIQGQLLKVMVLRLTKIIKFPGAR